jgi:hypothetical protein
VALSQQAGKAAFDVKGDSGGGALNRYTTPGQFLPFVLDLFPERPRRGGSKVLCLRPEMQPRKQCRMFGTRSVTFHQLEPGGVNLRRMRG